MCTINAELAAARIKRLSFSNRKSSPANHLKPFVIKLARSSNTKARASAYIIHFYIVLPAHTTAITWNPAKGRWSLHCTRVKPTIQKPLSLAAAFASPLAHELQYIIYFIIISLPRHRLHHRRYSIPIVFTVFYRYIIYPHRREMCYE